jgi:uncharacterized protein YbdZ (MbtH family)
MAFFEQDPDLVWDVVVNLEEQYSIWPVGRTIPAGWRAIGYRGSKDYCLDHVERVWTDMRPLSLRQQMAAKRLSPEAVVDAPAATEPAPSLVDRLSASWQRVRVGGGATATEFTRRVKEGFVHIRFVDTQGETELGVHVDASATQLGSTVHVEGELTLDWVPVRCIAEINLLELTGRAMLCPVANL